MKNNNHLGQSADHTLENDVATGFLLGTAPAIGGVAAAVISIPLLLKSWRDQRAKKHAGFDQDGVAPIRVQTYVAPASQPTIKLPGLV